MNIKLFELCPGHSKHLEVLAVISLLLCGLHFLAFEWALENESKAEGQSDSVEIILLCLVLY